MILRGFLSVGRDPRFVVLVAPREAVDSNAVGARVIDSVQQALGPMVVLLLGPDADTVAGLFGREDMSGFLVDVPVPAAAWADQALAC